MLFENPTSNSLSNSSLDEKPTLRDLILNSILAG